MSLETALNTAKSSLSATQKRIAVSARNVAGADDPYYSRKLANTVSGNNAVYVVGPTRAGDTRLYERYLDAVSRSAREQELLAGLTRFAQTVGDTQAGTSLVGRLGSLTDKLTEYLNAPNDDNLARAAVVSAKDMARSLNDAAAVVNGVREVARQDVAVSVDRINTLLKDLEVLNTAILRGTGTGADVTDQLDQRDLLIGNLSEEIGITVVRRANDDVVLYTDGGVTLFETTARDVRHGMTGGEVHVYVDNVEVLGSAPQMQSKSGRLAGLVELHNDVVADYAHQLDTLAYGLIQAFREVDPADPPVGADVPGLFVDTEDAANLPAGIAGLASTIAVNPAVDPAANPPGTPSSLRDGISGVYDYNTEGAPAFAGQLSRLLDQLGAKDVALGGKNPLDYAAQTVSWVEGSRQSSKAAAGANDAVLQLTATALSNTSGVDLNDELAQQLELERLYAASAKLISVVNSLFKTLLDAV